ncbi:PaaD-like zinc ribbon domain-containing protein [Amycolatopsis alkalitolerans]
MSGERPPDRLLFPADSEFAGVTCPDCDTAEIEVVSLFGSSASEVLFQCLRCRSLFNWVKWSHRLPPIPIMTEET